MNLSVRFLLFVGLSAAASFLVAIPYATIQ